MLPKKIIISLISLASFAFAADDTKGYYFYSAEDLANVKKSAETSWGKEIVSKLEKKIEARRKYDLKVIPESTGRYHSYFCPVHATLFDFRWDSPESHKCTACDKEYPGKRGAWLYMFHFENSKYLLDCMWAYMASGDKKFEGYIKEMLLDYANVYPTLKEYSAEEVKKKAHIGRLFDQFLDEANWFTNIARAYSVIQNNITSEERKTIEEGLFRNGANLLMNRQGGNNWQVWNNSGRIMIGIILHDDKIVDTALNAKGGYVEIVKKEVNKDGWYNEASAGYHFFPLHAFIHTANAARCRGINLFDEQFYSMFGNIINGIYPDMRFIAHNDGWYGISTYGNADLYEFAYTRFKNPFLLEVLGVSYAYGERIVPEALLTNTEIVPAKKPLKLSSYLFEQTGFGILKDGKNSLSLVYGQPQGGHSHPSKLSITLHNGKNEIISDMGTCGYGLKAYGDWYKRTLAHSTLTLDFKDQLIDIPYGKADKDGKFRNKRLPAKLDDFKASADGGSMEVSTLDHYASVAAKRSVSLKNGFVKDLFECTSDEEHVYEYVLIFLEKPSISAKSEDVELTESIAHSQIKNVKKYKFKNNFAFKTKSAEIIIDSSASPEMEVFVGEALGPVISAYEGQGQTDSTSYPLIVRTKGKNMKISTSIKIK